MLPKDRLATVATRAHADVMAKRTAKRSSSTTRVPAKVIRSVAKQLASQERTVKSSKVTRGTTATGRRVVGFRVPANRRTTKKD